MSSSSDEFSLLWRNWNTDVSVGWLSFLAAIFKPLKGTPLWRLQTKLYNLGILHMKYRTDLSLGKPLCILIYIHFSDSKLSVFNLHFFLYEFLKRWILAFVKKLEQRCFCWFSAAIFKPLKGTPTWRLHTKLYKFGQNIFPSILHMKYRTDLILGWAFCIFSSFFSRILNCLYRISLLRRGLLVS